MKKKFFTFFLLMISALLFSQKYNAKNAKITFEASVPFFEDIYAENKTASALLNADTGDIVVMTLVKNYKFKVALMEEHFNENYAESSKFPKSYFKGKILNFNKIKLSETLQNVTLKGILNFHGVDKETTLPGKISIKDGEILLSGNFLARPQDFNVKIPKMVTKKIAENVTVIFEMSLEKQ